MGLVPLAPDRGEPYFFEQFRSTSGTEFKLINTAVTREATATLP